MCNALNQIHGEHCAQQYVQWILHKSCLATKICNPLNNIHFEQCTQQNSWWTLCSIHNAYCTMDNTLQIVQRVKKKVVKCCISYIMYMIYPISYHHCTPLVQKLLNSYCKWTWSKHTKMRPLEIDQIPGSPQMLSDPFQATTEVLWSQVSHLTPNSHWVWFSGLGYG